jgi:hypothetical protein
LNPDTPALLLINFTSGASIISLSPSHISFATAASLLPSLRMDFNLFNLQTQKKTQNIHNNNNNNKKKKKDTTSAGERESLKTCANSLC